MSLSSERKAGERGEVRLFLRGVIDERADLEAVFRHLACPVSINLGGVERINSIGVNRWIQIFSAYATRHPTTLEHLSYAMVMQANSIANMFSVARILSCLAPYYCDRCATTTTAVVTAEDVASSHPAVPEKTCPTCGTKMAFDELDSYFDFIMRKS